MHPDGSTFAIRAACAATLIELGQILRCTVVYLRDVRRSLELSFVSCRKTASKIKKKEKASGGKEGEREKRKRESRANVKQTETPEENIHALGKIKTK